VNWDAIGAIAESVGALGVIGSLIYLAVQIRSNTKQLRFDATQTIAESMDRALDPMYVGNNAAIWVKGLKDLDALDEAERAIFHGLMGRQLHNVFNTFEAGRMDVVDTHNTQLLYRKFFADRFSEPGAQQWLKENAHFVDAGFVDDVRDHL
jgi:hypothetical protein